MLFFNIKTPLSSKALLTDTDTDTVLQALFGSMTITLATMNEQSAEEYDRVRREGIGIKLTPSNLSLYCDPSQDHLCLKVPESIFEVV